MRREICWESQKFPGLNSAFKIDAALVLEKIVPAPFDLSHGLVLLVSVESGRADSHT